MKMAPHYVQETKNEKGFQTSSLAPFSLPPAFRRTIELLHPKFNFNLTVKFAKKIFLSGTKAKNVEYTSGGGDNFPQFFSNFF